MAEGKQWQRLTAERKFRLFLETRQGQLEEQLFRFELEKERRPLLSIERERKAQIERELARIRQQIQREQKKANPSP